MKKIFEEKYFFWDSDGWKNPCGHVDYYRDVAKEYFDSHKKCQWRNKTMDKLDRIILGIGIGIFCAVIGWQLGLHNSDIQTCLLSLQTTYRWKMCFLF